MANDAIHSDRVIDRPGWLVTINPHLKVTFTIQFNTAFESEVVIDPSGANVHFDNMNNGIGPHVYTWSNPTDQVTQVNMWTEYKRIARDPGQPWYQHAFWEKQPVEGQVPVYDHIWLRFDDDDPANLNDGDFDYNDVVIDLFWQPI